MIASDSFSGRYQDLLHGNDEHLDDAHLMRWAGRFARRLHAMASGSPHLSRKSPPVWVNHFVFHFQDPDWGT